MTRRVFVISDLHGYFDLLMKLLEKISFSESDMLYIIGDVCDRGPDSLKILFYIQNHDNIILLKGNHEYMMHEAIYYGVYHDDFDYPTKAFKLWLANGGYSTMQNIRQYLKKDKLKHEDYRVVRNVFLKNLYEYLNNLPEYLEIEIDNQKYVLVHAGIDVNKTLDKQNANTLLWIREEFYLQQGDKTKTYIFGHTPTAMLNQDQSFNIWLDEVNYNKIGIDGGLACGDMGQLNCLCLNNSEVTIIHKNELI